MTEFYKNIKYQSVEELEENLKTIQNEIEHLPTKLTHYLQYVREGGLEMKTTGTNKEQIESLESVLDRMKEIVQQKTVMNQQKEIILKNIEEIFEKSALHEKDVEELKVLKEYINIKRKVCYFKSKPDDQKIMKTMNEIFDEVYYNSFDTIDIDLNLLDKYFLELHQYFSMIYNLKRYYFQVK